MIFEVRKDYKSELRDIDWDFDGAQSSSGFAAYHWYPARYVPQLAGVLINYFSRPGDTILDPFCGSGTTVVEALKFGRRAVGIDVQPVAVLITRAKVLDFDETQFDSYIEYLTSCISGLMLHNSRSLLSLGDSLGIPNYDVNAQWYEANTLHELASIWTAIHECSLTKYRVVAEAAFSAILKSCCSQEKHWGWVCDNVKPKSLAYRPAYTRYREKLAEYRAAAINLRDDMHDLQEHPVFAADIEVLQGDCRTLLATKTYDSIDLVVTSPPYFNMTDYTAAQRLSLLWFGGEIEALRVNEIGARYRRFRKDPQTEYLLNMQQAFDNIYRVLKSGHYCCVVIGESPRHKPFLEALQDLWSNIGFVIEDVLTRKIAKKRSLSPVLHNESIYILRKHRFNVT